MKNIKISKKNLLQYIFLISLMGLTTYLVFRTLDINTLSSVLAMVDKKFLVFGFLTIAFHIILEGVVLKIIIDSIQKVDDRFIGFKLATMGFYYNLVTPFASGSQPMQIYILNKGNITLSKASAVVTNKSIIYQIVVTIYCGILVLMNMTILRNHMSIIMPLVFLGIAINAFTLIIAVLVVLNPTKIKKFIRYCIVFISKFKLFKSLENKIDKVEKFIDDYSQSIGLFVKNKWVLLKTVVLTIIQLTAYFSTSFWIYKAFNLDGHSYLYILTLQAFLYMAISPVPTPGNIGANELAFFTIFKSVFPKPLMGYAVFLYGGFMYYMILIGSGIFTIITHYRIKNKLNNIDSEKNISISA